MCIPSLCVDYCQGMIGNQTSWNSIIADKKLLRVNDEIILIDEFTADEMLNIQYKMGNMFEYLLNRKNYHHSATFPLLVGNARNINASLVVKHKNGLQEKSSIYTDQVMSELNLIVMMMKKINSSQVTLKYSQSLL